MIVRFRDAFRHVPRTVGLVWRTSQTMTLWLVFGTLLSATLPLGIATVGKRIVDAVVAADAIAARNAVIAELVLVVCVAAVGRLNSLAWQLLGARLSVEINTTILDKTLSLSLADFEDPSYYDQLTRARREASTRPLSTVTSTFSLGQNLLSLVGYAGLLVAFSPWVVLGLLLSAIPAAIVEMRYSRAAYKMRNWRAPETRRLNYLEYVLANDEHHKEVQIFGLGPWLLGRYRELADQFYADDRRLAIQRSGAAFALSLLGTGAFYLCYALMVGQAAAGAITVGALTLYLVAFRQGQQSFQGMLGAIGSMYEDNLYMSNLFAFLERPPSPSVGPERGLPRDEKGIRFEGVGFKYPGKDEWALRGIDLYVPPGEKLALVGQNGAGKTTFIKLLTRMYEPSEGRIFLDGRDLRDWPEAELHRRFGVVFQDFNQYQFAVRENVGLGSLPHKDDPSRVGRAIESGGATDVIAGLKDGLDTPLGRWFEKGVELSGGQWQKIALSRAFMREEADMLILDEPTAALDAEAEHAVFERFQRLAAGRTTVVISHRFPTVRMADRILVLEGGRIVEQGSHDALTARNGRYAALFALQAKGYQ